MLQELGWPWLADPDEHTRKVREVMAKLQEDRCGAWLQLGVCWSVIILHGACRMHVAGVSSDDVDLDSWRAALLGTRVSRHCLVGAAVVMPPILSQAVRVQVVHVVYVVTCSSISLSSPSRLVLGSCLVCCSAVSPSTLPARTCGSSAARPRLPASLAPWRMARACWTSSRRPTEHLSCVGSKRVVLSPRR